MGILGFLKSLIKKHFEDDTSVRAGYFTYYLLLSFFPLIIFIVAVISSTPLIREIQISFNNTFIPSAINIFVSDLLNEMTDSKNIGIISFSILGAIWAASRSMLALIKGVNAVYGEKETRNFIMINVYAVFITIIFVILLLVIVGSVVFGDILIEFLSKKVGLYILYGYIKYVINTAIPFLLLFSASLFIYKVSPNISIKLKKLLPGALFFSFGGILLSKVFAIYVNHFGNYTKIYGSLTGVIVFLLWLNLISNMLIIGVEINSILYKKDE